MLAAGLALSFAFAGTLLTYLVLTLGLSTEVFRYLSIILLTFIGLTLLSDKLNQKLSLYLSMLTSLLPSYNPIKKTQTTEFLIGISLGLVWLPCVGPTLGTAIALASTGQNLLMSFIVMLTFGIGTAIPLFLIGRISKKSIPYVITKGAQGRKIMAYSLLFLAIVLLTKFDRVLEGIAINYLPSIFFSI